MMANTNDLRVFISSTFRDLQEEREHLVKRVFPEIRALCRERGVTFTEIDLRWGLTEEQATMGHVIRACLEEVDRCRPYFIGMIGDRYGWVPELHDVMIDPDLLDRYPFIEELVLEGKSVTEMEFVHALFSDPDAEGDHAFFYHRESPVRTNPDSEDAEKLDDLVERARTTGRPFREFDDVENLGRMVHDDLVDLVEERWPIEEAPDEATMQRRAHAAYAASRTRGYIPNPDYLRSFKAWLAEETRPLVVRGVSGLGKSSFVAWATDQYRRKNRSALVIEHYVGSSPSSGSAAEAISHIAEAIRDHFGLTDDLPTEAGRLVASFPNWLFRAASESKKAETETLIVIDALNQMPEKYRRLDWLPDLVPEGVRLIVSTTSGEIDERLMRREWATLEITPITEERVRESIVVRYLGEFHKGVSTDQLRRIGTDPNASSPLYLRTVAEELRLHGVHETIEEVIDSYTGLPDLPSLFDRLLERLEVDFGRDLVDSFCSLVDLSRSGLAENELLELTGASRLDLSRLLFGFDYHMVRREGLLDFFHAYLRAAAHSRYLAEDEKRLALRRQIADYFKGQPPGLRSGEELLTQYLEMGGSRGNEGLIATLTNPLLVDPLLRRGNRFEVYSAWQHLIEAGFDPEQEYEERSGLSEQSSGPELDTVAQILFSLGRWKGAERYYRMLIGQQNMRAQMTGFIGISQIMKQTGRYDESIEYVEKGIALAEEAEDDERVASALHILGRSLSMQGRHDEAIACFERALNIGEARSDHSGIAASYGNLGLAHVALDRVPEGVQLLEQAAEISERIGDLQGSSIAINNLGTIYYDRQEWEEARDAFGRAAEIDKALGDRNGLAICVGNLGNIYHELGEPIDALKSYREATAVHRDTGFLHGLTFWLNGASATLLDIVETQEAPPSGLDDFLEGETSAENWRELTLAAAAALAEEGRRISQELGKPGTLFFCDLHLARIDRHRGETEASRERLLKILSREENHQPLGMTYYHLWKLEGPDASEREKYRTLGLEHLGQVREDQRDDQVTSMIEELRP